MKLNTDELTNAVRHPNGAVTAGFAYQPVGLDDRETARRSLMHQLEALADDRTYRLIAELQYVRSDRLLDLQKNSRDLNEAIAQKSSQPETAKRTFDEYREHFMQKSDRGELFEDHYYLFLTLRPTLDGQALKQAAGEPVDSSPPDQEDVDRLITVVKQHKTGLRQTVLSHSKLRTVLGRMVTDTGRHGHDVEPGDGALTAEEDVRLGQQPLTINRLDSIRPAETTEKHPITESVVRDYYLFRNQSYRFALKLDYAPGDERPAVDTYMVLRDTDSETQSRLGRTLEHRPTGRVIEHAVPTSAEDIQASFDRSLPGRAILEARPTLTTDAALECFAPLDGTPRPRSTRPVFILPDERGTYTTYDPHDQSGDRNNWHKLAIGSAGTGKSVFNNLKNYLYNLYFDTPFCVVEAGESARSLIESLDGLYVKLGTKNAPTINPLYSLYNPPECSDEELLQDYLFRQRNLNVQLIAHLCFEDNEEAIARHRSVIGQAVSIAVEAGKASKTEPTYSVVQKTLTDVIPDKEDDPQTIERAREVAGRLSEFVGKGVYADVFDGQHELPQDAQPIGINTEAILQDRLMRDEVFTFITQLLNVSMARYRRDQTVFVDIDEYHAYAKNDRLKDDFSYSLRMQRRFGNVFTVLSQNPDDFGDDFGQVLRDNCTEQLFFGHREPSQPALKKHFTPSEREAEAVLQNTVSPGEYSELVLRRPDSSSKVRLELNDELMELAERGFQI